MSVVNKKSYSFKIGQLYMIKELTFTMFELTAIYTHKEGDYFMFEVQSRYPLSQYRIHKNDNKSSLYEITPIN